MPHRSPARSRRLACRARAFAPGAIDRPNAAEPIAGRTVAVVGWTWPFKDERVRRVELLVDGAPAGAARLALRPDISEAFDRPEAALSGFEGTIELDDGARDREIALSLEVHGLDGKVWTAPGWRLPIAPAGNSDLAPETAADGVDTAELSGQDEPGARIWPATATLDGPDRNWTRRRLGYDPSHVVVLVAEPLVAAGPAIAALDVLAERWPNLELLIPGVRSDSYLANLMQRATRHMGLDDRVTVPFVPAPADGWRALADLELTASMPGAAGDDLGVLVDALDAVCRAAR